MTNPLVTAPDQKEGLSLVYAKALATRLGYLTSVPSPDRDSIDLRIQAGGRLRPALDLQLKATVNLRRTSAGTLPFRLSIKNYDDLRVHTQTPRLLVVLQLPEDESQWMRVTTDELILRCRAYWLSLQTKHKQVHGQNSVTVQIPEGNVFDLAALEDLMERSRAGGIW